MKFFVLITIIGLIILSPISNYAGEEFLVNTYTDGDQMDPDVAIDSAGNFVITWQSYGQDGSEWGIYAQKYDNDGNPVGSEFQVNTFITTNQYHPNICMSNNGSFVITWTCLNPDGSCWNIFAQRYDKDCNKLGDEFRINDKNSGYDFGPIIAGDGSGNFIISWRYRDLQDTMTDYIMAKRYDNLGNPIGSEFEIKHAMNDIGGLGNCSIAMSHAGNFVSGTDYMYSVYTSSSARLFDNNANLIKAISVSYDEDEESWYSNAVMDGNGNFVITYERTNNSGWYNNIFAKKYDCNGNQIGDEILVKNNAYYGGGLTIAIDSSGNFIIVWSYRFDLFAKKYDYNANEIGEEFQVNTYSSNSKYLYSSVTMSDNGNIIVTWQREHQDGSGCDIYARQLSWSETPTPTMTASITPTITASITPTITASITPTITASITPTITASMTPTSTAATSPTITMTSTLSSTPILYDTDPILRDGQVVPVMGNQNTTFEYHVYYNDGDGGYPPITRVYINNTFQKMSFKPGDPGNGWYQYFIPGKDLIPGHNEFYFLFVDDEGDYVRLPESGQFQNPVVEVLRTPTLSPTTTPIHTMSPSATATPTATPEKCLQITSPEDFFYNTILLSWTPIDNVDHYRLYCMIAGYDYFFDVENNWTRLILNDMNDWECVVNLGTITYSITALDADGNIIEGPTDLSYFRCYSENSDSRKKIKKDHIEQNSISGCLKITNPPDFYYNTLLLSWTPVSEALYYEIEYKFQEDTFFAVYTNNWVRLIFPDEELWQSFVKLGSVEYRVSAYDIKGNIINGPSDWSRFICY